MGDPYYIGAVAVAAVIFDFLYWGMGFLRMGTTGIMAQIHGRKDADGMRTTLVHALFIAFFISFVILVFQQNIASVGLGLIGGSAEVLGYARQYFDVAVWGAPAVLASMSLYGCLLGMQNARATLYFALCVNCVNIVLDLVFVLVLDMGVRGVAIASVIAQLTGFILAIYLVRKELLKYPGSWVFAHMLRISTILRLMSLNRDIFIRTLCLIFVFAFFTRQGARQGDVILATNAVLLNFQALLALGLDGFANACEALVGKYIGAGNKEGFYKAIKEALKWSVVIAFGFTIFYSLAGMWLVSLMTNIPAVLMSAENYLPWLIVSPLICIWCFLLDGIFIGAMRGRQMRNSMLVSTFMIFLPAWYLSQDMANHGLWLAFMTFFIARGLTLGMSYYRIEKYQGGFVNPH